MSQDIPMEPCDICGVETDVDNLNAWYDQKLCEKCLNLQGGWPELEDAV